MILLYIYIDICVRPRLGINIIYIRIKILSLKVNPYTFLHVTRDDKKEPLALIK